ncbi:formyltransferase family protein [Halobacteriovorax sp. GB3]|uniref:formyltransferase family protein n=1 Tax=Halobacteriovorax sp. GB3 TaxID=2719615 RepID=UPI00235E9D15|nr:formyltransferase family protein [Halobacteriovorax sp. GB3]MDD0852845.1 formyltransferase family protein [Halobacteriovorax sp. GB3]
MKIAIICSKVTFVPNNYMPFITKAINELNKLDIEVHLIISQNNSLEYVKKGALLFLAGARDCGLELMKNELQTRLSCPKEQYAKQSKISFIKVSNLNSDMTLNYIREKKIDLLVNARTRTIFKKRLLKIAPLGAINIHHGLLPKDRGTLCDLYEIAENRDAGFSIHKMSEKLDDGEILKTYCVQGAESENKDFKQYQLKSMHDEANQLINLIKETIELKTLPTGHHNTHEEIRYYKTPNLKTIRSLLEKGIKI